MSDSKDGEQPFFSGLFNSGDGRSSRSKNSGLVHRAEVAMGIKEEEPSTYDTCCDALGCGKLPWKYRIGGFVGCSLIGMILSLGSLARLEELLAGNPAPFVILFVFGHLITLVGSMFLSTPKVYAKKACDKYHWGATTFFFVAMFLTLFCAFYDGIPDGARIGIIVISILVEYAAYFWFTLSMIPFVARIQQDFCRNKCRKCFYAVCPCFKPKESSFFA